MTSTYVSCSDEALAAAIAQHREEEWQCFLSQWKEPARAMTSVNSLSTTVLEDPRLVRAQRLNAELEWLIVFDQL